MFAKINRAAFVGLLLMGLGTAAVGANAAPSARGCCDTKSAACCVNKTRCCDSAVACCDSDKAACCEQKTNCCETGRKSHAATCEVTVLKRAQCCASKASPTPPCCQKGCSTPGSSQR